LFNSIFPANVFAALDSQFYDTFAASSSIVTPHGTTSTTTIVNRSDKKYFVPNKTTPEWKAFALNTPQYVSISTCGDGLCGDGENSTSCYDDCGVDGYCGDGICANSSVIVHHDPPLEVDVWEQVCQEHARGWIYVPLVNFFVIAIGQMNYTTCDNVLRKTYTYNTYEPRGEVYSVQYPDIQKQCMDDCAAPAGTGCGSCGYDSSGNLCPNYCTSGRGYNLTNCVYQASYTQTPTNYTQPPLAKNNSSIKKYLTASEAQAFIAQSWSDDPNPGYTYTVPASYHCDFGGDSSNLCPAGYYCPITQGIKPSATLTNWVTLSPYFIPLSSLALQPTCPAGHFCQAGSYFARTCPKNTWSAAGSSSCTSCDPGTESGEGSPSIDFCLPKLQSNDGVCQGDGVEVDGVTKENPANSPADCPDASQVGKLWFHDGRCTGMEDAGNDPAECACGADVVADCNNGETYLSCLKDCYPFDGVCGTRTSKYDPVTNKYITKIYPEKNVGKYNGKLIPSDCAAMNSTDVCGDGVCGSSEGLINGKIVCPLDCHCGDGTCGTGEFYSPTGAAGSCNQDCHCGDGHCDAVYGEYPFNCEADCHCGNGICDTTKEDATICSQDCRCGDHICSYGEDSTLCLADCPMEIGYCGDNICNYKDKGNGQYQKETIGSCPQDCHVYNPF